MKQKMALFALATTVVFLMLLPVIGSVNGPSNPATATPVLVADGSPGPPRPRPTPLPPGPRSNFLERLAS